VAYNLVRRLKEREHPLVVVLHFQLVGVVVGFLFTLFNWVTPLNLWDWFCLLMTGILTQLGQVHLTKSLQAERVANVSILNYTGLIYALIFGVFIFGEIYTIQVLLGISLVVLGVLLSLFYSKRQVEIVDETTAA
jgi:drug/metabolite transporter (DMT)-like permease